MLQIRDLTVTMKKDLRDLLRGFTFALNPGCLLYTSRCV